ncbi:MAG TPA: protein kinase, partial [Chlamydiales bacterium]|nr:protein kinase [Chlamydiales bacterium]
MALELSGRFFNGPSRGVTSERFGPSTGETVSDRIEFEGFEGEKYRVAIATKEPFFAARYFKQDIRVNGGEPQPVWININSFKKRFSSGVKNAAYLKAIDHLMKVLPEHLIPELGSDYAAARIALIRQSILKHSFLSKIQPEEIVDCYRIADEKAKGLSGEIVKIGAKATALARSILMGPTGKFLLLTQSTKKEDRIIAEGSYKKVKFAVNLDTGAIKAVAIAKKSNLPEGRFWPREREAIAGEMQMMEACRDNGDVVHLDFGYHLDPLEETTSEEKYYFLMDYCESGDLFQRIHANGFPIERSTQHLWILEMARGLTTMHQQGILHRDLKPHNIFLQKDPASDGKPAKVDDDTHAKIGDLGFA